MRMFTRLERLETAAASRPAESVPGLDMAILTSTELRYLVHLLGPWRRGGTDMLGPDEREDLARLLALARGELSCAEYPCQGEFQILDYPRHVYGFGPCPDCGRKHPAPARLPELPPAAAWLHLLPEQCRSEQAIGQLSFFVRQNGAVVPFLKS